MNKGGDDNSRSSGNHEGNNLQGSRDHEDPNPCSTLPNVIKRNNQLQLSSLAGGAGRWSVEENSLIIDEDAALSPSNGPLTNGHSQVHYEPNVQHNGVHEHDVKNTCGAPVTSSLCFQKQEIKIPSLPEYLATPNILDSTEGSYKAVSSNNVVHNGPSSENQNVLEDSKYEYSIRSKISNSSCVRSTSPLLEKDNVEYFNNCSNHSSLMNDLHKTSNIHNELSLSENRGANSVNVTKALTTTTITTATVTGGTTREVRAYNSDHFNLLNGDDYEDEDGCIYTYKEVPGFEENLLNHLLTTCVSCGLPNLDVLPKSNTNCNSAFLANEELQDNNVGMDAANMAACAAPNDENVFSPEMDFLEMDFDPGSNAEDLEVSEGYDYCVTNALSSAHNNKQRGATAYLQTNSNQKHAGAGAALQYGSSVNKANNLSPERRSLMLCRRCENDSSITGKMDNIPPLNASAMNGTTSALNFTAFASSPTHYSGESRKSLCTDNRTGAISKKIEGKNDSDDTVKTNKEVCVKKAVIAPLDLNLKQTSSGKYCNNVKVNCNDCSSDSSSDLEERSSCFKMNKHEAGSTQNASCEGSRDDSNHHLFNVQEGSARNLSHDAKSNRSNVNGYLNSNSDKPDHSKDGKATSGVIQIHANTCQNSCNANNNKVNGEIMPNIRTNSCCNPVRSVDKNISNNPSNICVKNIIDNEFSQVGDSTGTDSSTNNNLGSLSAPEVSPAHEYPHQDRFKRSISFHNQLSSPKYDNMCFPPARQENLDSDCSVNNISGAYNILTNMNNVNSDCHPTSTSYLRNHRHSHPFTESNALNEWYKAPARYQHNNVAEHSVSRNIGPQSPSTWVPKNPSTPKKSFGIDLGKKHLSQREGDDESVAANVSACSSRLNSREKALFNITDHSAILKLIVPSYQSSSSANRSSSPVNSLVVKGSLPPKTSDPSLDVNTTPLSIEENCSCPRIQEKVMVWTERQATARQVLQTQASACGLSAVANVLLALDQHVHPNKLIDHISINKRAENASLVKYLLSRSSAGTTHKQLIDGMKAATNGSVSAKFFPMFPKRAVQLSRWLSGWIQKGGVCVCTLNLQCGVAPGETIPDAWHHQMVFGVGPQGIYLTNPVECVCEAVISTQLCSERVLLVKREDILQRWTSDQSLWELLSQEDPRWAQMNVLGQVATILKEDVAASMWRTQRGRQFFTSHVRIPAEYHSGITVFMRSDNPHVQSLLEAQDLTLLE